MPVGAGFLLYSEIRAMDLVLFFLRGKVIGTSLMFTGASQSKIGLSRSDCKWKQNLFTAYSLLHFEMDHSHLLSDDGQVNSVAK